MTQNNAPASTDTTATEAPRGEVEVKVNSRSYMVELGSTIKDLVCRRLKNKVASVVTDAAGAAVDLKAKIESALELTVTPPAEGA